MGKGIQVEEEGNSTGPSWIDIVKGNRAYGNGQTLEYSKPGMEVVISDEEWTEGEKTWQHTLAAKFGKSTLVYDEVVKWAGVNWKRNTPGISLLKPGIFLFEFKSGEQKLDALSRSWTFYHKYPIIFKPWNVDTTVDQLQIETQPILIQFPELPPRYWPPKVLGKMVSFIGKPVSTDRLTANRKKLEYARVLVDVNKNLTVLPDEIPIRGPKGVYMQSFI